MPKSLSLLPNLPLSSPAPAFECWFRNTECTSAKQPRLSGLWGIQLFAAATENWFIQSLRWGRYGSIVTVIVRKLKVIKETPGNRFRGAEYVSDSICRGSRSCGQSDFVGWYSETKCYSGGLSLRARGWIQIRWRESIMMWNLNHQLPFLIHPIIIRRRQVTSRSSKSRLVTPLEMPSLRYSEFSNSLIWVAENSTLPSEEGVRTFILAQI